MPSPLSDGTSQKLLSSWDAKKQSSHRGTIGAPVFHVLLDASTSMDSYKQAVVSSYNRYLRWCQKYCSPLGQWESWHFCEDVSVGRLVPLRAKQPLAPHRYCPEGMTALYDALGAISSGVHGPGQHILIVLSDGDDNASQTWTEQAVCTVLTELQLQEGWLCVFLGVFQDALAVARRCGFLPGNCLVFPAENMPEAFEQLRNATQTFLAAPQAERKLLAAGGVF